MDLFSAAIAVFLIANPIGNSPAIVALLSKLPLHRQRRILLRESLIAGSIALFFLILGEHFLSVLDLQLYTLRCVGGVIMFLVGFELIFPKFSEATDEVLKEEPLIVPIATPLISGPGVMGMVMLLGHQEPMTLIFPAVCLAFLGVVVVLTSAPYLTRVLGVKGMKALERLMGMLLLMMGVEAFVNAMNLFAQSITKG